MKRLIALLLPAGIAISIGCLSDARAANISAEVQKQIDQMKTDAEAKKDMPKELPGVVQVTADEAFKLWKAKSAIFLDNRVKTQFDSEKIEGAQWLFADDLLKDPGAAKLDKAKKYVAYCNGAHCWRSPAVILVLKSMGYDNILWFRDGIPEWKKKGFATE
jgi:rhodanese-related sulfurtransferase